ncbi:MAG: ATP-grasp domain-containing protein [Candidatus Saccharibacteria bacterium]|nr:ATP-grasp domain-containing protein [Candidatus Saccharibacteria bacterium]
MKNIILAIDRVEPGLVKAAKRIEKNIGYKIQGVRLVGRSYKEMHGGTYAPDETGFFQEIVVDYDDTEKLKYIIDSIKDNILAVNCRDESSIQSFAKVIPMIPDVPTPSVDSLTWATQKNHMRERMSKYDINLVPKYTEITRNDLHQIDKIISTFTFPLIIKPCGLHTSMLVKKCNNYEELIENLEKTYKVIDDIYDKRLGNGKPTVIVEEFIVGEMYSIDAYIGIDGNDIYCLPPIRVITSHDVGLKGFYAYESRVPSELSEEETKNANKACISAIKSLNLASCTAHVELFHTVNGWKIVELGPRIGGHREQIYRYAYGIDHYYNDLCSRIENLDLDIDISNKNYTISMNIYANEEGVVKEIQGTEEVKKFQTNVFIRELIKTGDFAGSSESGNPYHIDAIFCGKDKDQVIYDATLAHKIIHIEVNK